MEQQHSQQGSGIIEITRNLQTRNVGRAMGLNDSDFCVIKRTAIRSGRATFALAYDRGGRMFPIPVTPVSGLPMGQLREAMTAIKRGARRWRIAHVRGLKGSKIEYLRFISDGDPIDPYFAAQVVNAVAECQSYGEKVRPLSWGELIKVGKQRDSQYSLRWGLQWLDDIRQAMYPRHNLLFQKMLCNDLRNRMFAATGVND